jgi:serine/threonine protein kinase
MVRDKTIEFRTVFGATYQSEGVIGQGGAGTVYAARDDQEQQVAVKLLDPAKATGVRLKRFKNEYLFGFRNEYPNLLRVLDYGLVKHRGSDAPFYVMPRYSGSLRHLLIGGLTMQAVLPIFSQLLLGVEAAHLLKVTHRDLKPENVLANGQSEIVIADFGIARFEEEELYTAVETQQNDRMANFMYAAPEQKKRGAKVDHRADIFALGLMLNELFTGEVPQGEGYRRAGSVEVTYGWVDDVVAKMIQAAPSARPDSVAAVRELLRLHSSLFETQQQLSAISKTVIPTSEIDDTLALEPPKLVGFDYDGRILTLKLDKPVNEGWINALSNMGSHTSVVGVGPGQFQIRGSEARVAASDSDAQDIVNYFKQWLPLATAKYRQTLAAERSRELERKRAELQFKREELERAQRVRNSLKL